MSEIRILIIDDQADVLASLRRVYETAGYRVCEAANCTEARDKLATSLYDLATVDVKLVGEDGLSQEDGAALALEIHEHYSSAIIMISEIDDLDQRSEWLRNAADDTIVKPVNVNELLSRTISVLRRRGHPTGARQNDTAHFNGWILDVKKHELRSPDGAIVELTQGDFNLLRNLLKHPQEALTRDQIIDMDTSIQAMSATNSDRAVDMRISRLRDRLGDRLSDKSIDEAANEQRLIRTVRGVGYMLAADVQWREAAPGLGRAVGRTQELRV